MKAIKYAPENYIGGNMESIAAVVNIGFVLLPLFLFVVLIRQLIQADYDLTITISIGILFSFYARHQFLKGKLHGAVISVVIFFNILLTIVCSLGNGINDIGIIGYPIIIGFSGIILDQKKLVLASGLSILGIIWLVSGKYFALYSSMPISSGNEGDFIISSLMIIIGGFVAFSLMSNMKIALKSAQKEISISKSEADNLTKQVNEKLEIIEEIHRAAINSLDHIQKLMEHKKKDSPFLEVYESVKRKVLVIEIAHKILLSEQAPIMLDIRKFTSRILAEYEQQLKTPAIHIDIGNESLLVRLDLAINYGICMIELIDEVDNINNEVLNIALKIENRTVTFKLTDYSNYTSKDQKMVMTLLTKQLKGSLERSENQTTLSFTPTSQK